jgi:hypothetical protein
MKSISSSRLAAALLSCVLSAALHTGQSHAGEEEVTVRVRDRDGRPIEDARVTLVVRERALPHGPRANFPEDARSSATRRTDAAGEARLAVPDAPCRFWGGLPGWQHVPGELLEAGRAPEVIDLVLAPLPAAHRIAGRVVTHDGATIPSFVRFVTSGPDLARVGTQVDARGDFELFVDEPGEVGGLLATSYHGPEAFLAPVHGGQTDVLVRLEPVRPLTIEVEDTSDRPLENVRLVLERRLLDHWVQDWPGPRQEDSAFLTVVPATRFRVTVSGHGYESLVRELEPEAVGPRLLLQLAPRAALEGVVRRRGAPVEGARVVLLDGQRPRTDPEAGLEDSQRPRGTHGQARSDAQGRFSLPIGHAGTFWIEADDGAGGAVEVGPLALEPGEEHVVDVELAERPPGTIVGRVRVAEGAALPTLFLEGPREQLWQPTPDGTFQVSGLAPGRWTVTPLAPGRGNPAPGKMGFPSHWFPMAYPDGPLTATEVVVESAGEVRVELDLTRLPACTLVGTLALDGAPLEPHPWDAGPYGMEADRQTAWLERLDRGKWEPCVARFRLDGSSRFVLAAHEPGDYRLRLDFSARGQHWTILDRVTLTRGESRWSFDVTTREVALPALEPDANGRFHGRWRWRGPHDLRAFVELPHLGPEGQYLLKVPTGEGAWME